MRNVNIVFHRVVGYNFSDNSSDNSSDFYNFREKDGFCMTLKNETELIDQLTDMTLKAGANLFKATKYLYALTAENYYNCNIKDFFKVVLNNIYNVDVLSAFQISIDDHTCSALNTREYFDVFRLIIYSFAVRLPVLCQVKTQDKTMSAKQITSVYNAVMEKGISNNNDAVVENFAQNLSLVKRSKYIPPYTSEWYRTYIFTTISELSEICNRNLFFMGASDMLFSLYFLCLEKDFETQITAFYTKDRQTS